MGRWGEVGRSDHTGPPVLTFHPRVRAECPRPVCVGLAVREAFESPPPQVPIFASPGGSVQAGGRRSRLVQASVHSSWY